MRLLAILLLLSGTACADPWQRHTIDRSSRGADGARLADVNGDGLPDIAVPWEEGGVIRVYVNPGPKSARLPWPAVTVGTVASPEDAVPADLDGDGAMDVVSCCEGKVRTVYVHWAPKRKEDYLKPGAWHTMAIGASKGKQQWMFALPMQIDGRHGPDLIAGSKGGKASVGWFEAPSDPRDPDAWQFHPLYKAGWIMSLEPLDVDADGDADVVVSDRYGANSGVLWLENPGPKAAGRGAPWPEHRIGAAGRQVLFLTCTDVDRDGLADVLASTREGTMLLFRREQAKPATWKTFPIANPPGTRNGKSVRVADIDLDGKLDIVHSANTGGNRQTPGVVWMSWRTGPLDPVWDTHGISGPQGAKFDLLQLLDLDGDGDLDVLTCEERDNLGVIWYENPAR